MGEEDEILSSNGVPCSPVNTTAQAAVDPHLTDREIIVEVPDPVAGSIHVSGKMIKFGRTEMVVGSAPVVGQHSEEILSGILGYSEERINELNNNQVVGIADKTILAD